MIVFLFKYNYNNMTKLIIFLLTITFQCVMLTKTNAISTNQHLQTLSKDSIDINLKFLSNNLFAEEQFDAPKPSLEINTNGKVLQIQTTKKTPGVIKILTFKGKLVYSVHQQDINGEFDISDLAAGKYIVMIEGKDFIESCKIQVF